MAWARRRFRWKLGTRGSGTVDCSEDVGWDKGQRELGEDGDAGGL